ncbi:MAG: ABC-2 transporter permease [Lachnospiraceae bacterium]|nr:ABC-2 transporter permease [Lachnospiraceae bacterium]
MRNILRKELKLSASPLSYIFLAFGLMFLLPGYPILCGAFFVTLGIFYSFQTAREANDIVYSALLPIAKRDVVSGKFLFVCMLELCAALLMAAAVVLRMTVFADAIVYRQNALMNANGFALGVAFLIFGLFNWIFVAGFFRTAYQFARPYVTYIVVAFLVVFAAEAVHFFPGMEAVNAFGTDHLPLQLALFGTGFSAYVLITFLSWKRACRWFETLDL